jgi:sortase family protein
VLLPALFTGAAVLVVAGGDHPHLSGRSQPVSELARRAETSPPLIALEPSRPSPGLSPPRLALDPGRARAGLQPPPLEPLSGGIRPAPPERISIPAAGLDAPVRPVAAHGGVLEVPDIGTAGWYAGGPRPGEVGRAVVIGHLDTHKGPGLFARVPSLPPGTAVTMVDSRGESHRYRVVGGAEVRKSRFPAQFVYGPADAPVLVLITCGGPFRPGRGYRDNILLYARAA